MSAAFSELDRLWQVFSASGVQVIPAGTSLWHCGRIPTLDDLDATRALWATLNPDRSDDYAGFAREHTTLTTLAPTKLEFAIARDLKAADFAEQSLLDFTTTYCAYDHSVMKRTVHAWMGLRGLDAIVRANRDPDEIVIARPRADLHFVSATPL